MAKKHGARQILPKLALSGLVFVLLASLLEIAYRFQLVDSYRPELVEYDSDRPILLVMGDSFSVGPDSYPTLIREAQDDYRVVNAAIGGSGIIQANAIASRRFDSYPPKVFLYQIYVGNDLLDLRYPRNWTELSFARSVYWLVAQRFRSLGFLNYRLGQIAASRAARSDAPSYQQVDDVFSAATFTPRLKIHTQAEPGLVEDTVRLLGDRRDDFDVLLDQLRELVAYCPEGCRAYFVVIPFFGQINGRYLERAVQLGNRVADPEAFMAVDYPFIEGLRQFVEEERLDFVTVVNPIAAFREQEAQGRFVYYQNDLHLNPYGQQVLAQQLVGELGIRLQTGSLVTPPHEGE